MTAQHWPQIKELLDQALDLERMERGEFLAELATDDPEVAREVEALLELDGEAGDFIEEPAFDIHGQDDPAVRVGQRLGPYRLAKEIGAGGMGAVYLAVRADQEYDKSVAVKVLKRGLDTEEIVHRFRNERQILAGLEHPNIARLLDGGTTPDGRPYLVMDHVEGRPVDLYCHEEGLDVDQRLELFLTVCAAVQFAHRNLVVHRDLKPSNILVSADGVPKLLDFGIARLLTPERTYTLPTAGVWRFLTPEYASPEQLTGAPITTATDVYSLGVLLYALLTDRRPYAVEDRSASALARVLEHAEPPKPSSVAPAERTKQLRGDLDNIVLTALRREPERRYGSVEALADDLHRHVEGMPVRATPDSLGYRVGKFVRRHRLGVAAVTVIALLLVTFGVVTTVLLNQAVEAREVAEKEQQKAETIADTLGSMFKSVNPKEGRDRRQLLARTLVDEGRDKLLGEEGKDIDPEVRADLLAILAQTYLELGHHEQARELTERSLQLKEDLYGEGSPELIEGLNVLAQVANESGDLESVEPRIERALKIADRELRPDHHAQLTLLNNLASIYSSKGDPQRAEEMHREILARRRAAPVKDRDDDGIAASLYNLAVSLKKQGKTAQALPLFRESLEMRQRLDSGAPSRNVAASHNGLASALEEEGRLAEAETHYRQAITHLRGYFEAKHPKLAVPLSNLAKFLTRQGKLADAEQYYQEALDNIDEDHPNRPRISSNLAALLLLQGKPEEAEEVVRQALALYEENPPGPTWWVADARSILGATLTAQGRFAEAEPLLLDAYTALAEDSKTDPSTTAEARQRIVELYEAWGRPDEADTWRAKAITPLDL